MNDVFRRLLAIDRLPEDASNLVLRWQHEWPAWLWFGLLVALAVVAAWSYRRLSGPRPARIGLAALRFALLALVAVVLAGPELVVPRERIERDWVVLLTDRSASMTIRDAAAPGENASTVPRDRRITRDEQLRRLVRDHADLFDRLAEEHRLLWLGFDGGAYPLEVDEATGQPVFGAPTGSRTDVDAAIAQARRRVAARPVSGLVLFSDGRSADVPDRAMLRRIGREGHAFISVPLGAPQPLADLVVERVEAPRRAFAHDRVPVRVDLERLGRAIDDPGLDAAPPPAGTIELVDPATGEVLISRRLDDLDLDLEPRPAASGDAWSVTLLTEPGRSGDATWEVRLRPDVPDLIDENTAVAFDVELVDRPLRVLFVEAYPRWDYRYLKTLLVREGTIDSSVMLLSADRDFAQEGNTPITRMPNSPEEFERFDVIVIGDVPAETFSPRQLEMIRDHVARRGAGLLWIAGPRAMPVSYAGTSLASLVPLRGSFALPHIGSEGVHVTPTPLADRLGLLRRRTPEGEDAWRQLGDPAVEWARLRWGLRLEPGDLKPAAEPLASTLPPSLGGTQAGPRPLVVHMRYGAGRSIFVATDEIWRWRYARGETLPEQFWIQIIRTLGRGRLASSGRPITLTATPRRVETGQPVVLELVIEDARLAGRQAGRMPVEIVEERTGETTTLDLLPDERAADRFATTWRPGGPGRYVVRALDPMFRGFDVEARFEVFRPDDELRRPAADHALLARVADQAGGIVLPPERLDELADLPNRSVRTPMDIRESIWDTPLVLTLFLGLLTIEWIGRKLLRLT